MGNLCVDDKISVSRKPEKEKIWGINKFAT